MMTAVSIFSCTNDYDPGLIENLGMKEQPLRIITKVLTTKSPNFMQEFTRGTDRDSSSWKVPADLLSFVHRLPFCKPRR